MCQQGFPKRIGELANRSGAITALMFDRKSRTIEVELPGGCRSLGQVPTQHPLEQTLDRIIGSSGLEQIAGDCGVESQFSDGDPRLDQTTDQRFGIAAPERPTSQGVPHLRVVEQ